MKVLVAVLCLLALPALAQSPADRLFEAIDEGKALVAEGIVARGQADLNARNKDGDTPLHLAIEKDMKELAGMLVKAGARVNARNSNSGTPLHAATGGARGATRGSRGSSPAPRRGRRRPALRAGG